MEQWCLSVDKIRILCSEIETKHGSCFGELKSNEFNMKDGMEFQGYHNISDDVPYYHDTQANYTFNASYKDSALINENTNISSYADDVSILFHPTSLSPNSSYTNEYTSLPGNEPKTIYRKLKLVIRIL